MVVEDLRSLKYSQLQKLAKNAGIKARQKADNLIKALEAYYQENGDGLEDIGSVPTTTEKPLPSSAKEPSSPAPLRQAKSNTPAVIAKPTGKRRRTDTIDKNENSITPTLKRQRRGTFDKTDVDNPADDTVSGRKRQRRSTFDKTDDHTEVTVATAKRKRSGTFDKTESPTEIASPVGKGKRSCTSAKIVRVYKSFNEVTNKETSAGPQAEDVKTSPGTIEMLAAMDPNLGSAERKTRLLQALQKKVQSKVAANSVKNSGQSSQIPRFVPSTTTSTTSKSETNLKPTTPGNKDWKKIHSKEFSKFDSLDVYLQKKQDRMNALSNSAKKCNSRIPAAKSLVKVAKDQKVTKPFVPTVTSTKNLNFNFGKSRSPSSTQRPISVDRVKVAKDTKVPKPFVPTVKSTKNLNFNFGKSPSTVDRVNVAKKTPKMATPSVSAAKSKAPGSAKRGTPFIFTGGANKNVTSLNTTYTTSNASCASKKAGFDIKASLAKPLSWKPHTGKLKPIDTNTSSDAKPRLTAAPAAVVKGRPSGGASNPPSRQMLASKTRTNNRANPKDVRRAQQESRRSNQKYIDMMKRRGLM